MARSYDKDFKEEALKLSDEIGAKKAADQLGIPYNTVTTWRGKRKKYGDQAFVGSGHKQLPASEQERSVKTGVGLPPARKKLATLPDFSFHLAGGSATPNRI